MKRLFTLLFTFILALPLFADKPSSRLSISVPGRNSYVILVDNVKYEGIRNSFSLDDLSSGYHNIKVYEARNERRNRIELFYATSLLFKPMHHVNIILNGPGKVLIDEQPLNRYGNGKGRDRDYDRDGRGDNDRRDNDRRDNDYNDYNRNGRGMQVSMFNSAKESLRCERFDNDKMRVARNILRDNYLSAIQVRELTQMFSFENGKLEFAKYAYSRTVDRNNYYLVYDAFSFRNSKQELEHYCQNFR